MTGPVLSVAQLLCGELHVEARAADEARVELFVRGERVDRGRGRASWWSPDPLTPGAYEVVARTDDGEARHTVDLSFGARVTLRTETIGRAGRVRVTLAAAHGCPAGTLTWRVAVPETGAEAGGPLPARPREIPLEIEVPGGRSTLVATLERDGRPVARQELRIDAGPACVDADRDGACTVAWRGEAADCDDADRTVRPGASDLPFDRVDQDCDGHLAGDDDRDGFAGPEDCDPGDPLVHPGAPELADGIDSDCDGVLPATEERRVGVGPRDGRFAVRDGDRWRLSRSRSFHVDVVPRPIPGPDGRSAWLLFERPPGTDDRVPYAQVVVAEGEHDLAEPMRVGVSGARARRPDPATGGGFWTREDVVEPVVTPDGFRVGDIDWRWFGEHLRPVPASPDAALEVTRATGSWFEVRNVGAEPVRLDGLAVLEGSWILPVRTLAGRAAVAPGRTAVIACQRIDPPSREGPLTVPDPEAPRPVAVLDPAVLACTLPRTFLLVAGDRVIATAEAAGPAAAARAP